jgi:hypothetical protein
MAKRPPAEPPSLATPQGLVSRPPRPVGKVARVIWADFRRYDATNRLGDREEGRCHLPLWPPAQPAKSLVVADIRRGDGRPGRRRVEHRGQRGVVDLLGHRALLL